MKTNAVISAVLCSILLVACNGNSSKTDNPRGLYRLQDITYEESGKVVPYPFNQYNYLTDTGLLLIYVEQDGLPNSTGSILNFTMTDNGHGIRPLNYTGRAPHNNPNEESEVYDCNSKELTVRWYNGREDLKFNYFFPYKSYIIEHYSTNKVSKNLKRAMKILADPKTDKNNKFIGVWHRRSGWFVINGEEIPTNGEMFRIHTEKEILLLFDVFDNNEYVYAGCQLRPCKYYGNEATKEGNIDCTVIWENDDCFEMTILNGKYEQHEVWERSGLSAGFQRILGTNIPINIAVSEAPQVEEILDDVIEVEEEIVEE